MRLVISLHDCMSVEKVEMNCIISEVSWSDVGILEEWVEFISAKKLGGGIIKSNNYFDNYFVNTHSLEKSYVLVFVLNCKFVFCTFAAFIM